MALTREPSSELSAKWSFARVLAFGEIERASRSSRAETGKAMPSIPRQLARYVRNVCQRRSECVRGNERSSRRVPAAFSGGRVHESAHGSRVERTTSPRRGSPFPILHLLVARAAKRIESSRGNPSFRKENEGSNTIDCSVRFFNFRKRSSDRAFKSFKEILPEMTTVPFDPLIFNIYSWHVSFQQ